MGFLKWICELILSSLIVTVIALLILSPIWLSLLHPVLGISGFILMLYFLYKCEETI